MSKKDKEIVVTPQAGALVSADAYKEFAGQGYENVSKDDYVLPFLVIVQSNTPLIDTNAAARPGMLFNTATEELFDGKPGAGVGFIPCYTRKYLVEWKPDRGGLVGTHPWEGELHKKIKASQKFGKFKMIEGDPKSNDLSETYYVYGLVVREDKTHDPVVMAFTSTKIKPYKAWISKLDAIQIRFSDGTVLSARNRNLPIYLHRSRITTVKQENNFGSFYNYSIGFDGKDAESCRYSLSDPIFLAAKTFYEQVHEDKVKVDIAATQKHQETSAAEDGETEIPFD